MRLTYLLTKLYSGRTMRKCIREWKIRIWHGGSHICILMYSDAPSNTCNRTPGTRIRCSITPKAKTERFFAIIWVHRKTMITEKSKVLRQSQEKTHRNTKIRPSKIDFQIGPSAKFSSLTVIAEVLMKEATVSGYKITVGCDQP